MRIFGPREKGRSNAAFGWKDGRTGYDTGGLVASRNRLWACAEDGAA